MIRKLIAAGVAAGLSALVLPALPAAASANSTARITSTQDVFPGARTYTLSVTNAESGILGQGTTINALRIELPTASANVANDTTKASLVTCGSFTGKQGSVGGTSIVDFRNIALAPGASFNCSIPTTVGAPASTDLAGNFIVKVSSDNFATNRNAAPVANGALGTAVRILEIIGGTVKPTAPSTTDATGRTRGVTDRTGTSGQVATYSFDVKNYARNAVGVTPALAVNSAAETPGTVTTPTSVPAGTSQTLSVPLTLGAVPSGSQRSVTVTAKATAPGATAAGVNDPFTVQGPVTLAASNLRPTRTKSGSMSQRDFTLDLTKTGVQSATLQASSLSFGTGNNTNTASAATPVDYNAGNGVNKNLTYPFSTVLGTDGALDASLDNTGIDDNGAPLGNGVLGLGLITIDNKAPEVTVNALLGNDRDGDQRTAATNGHSITINGTIIPQVTSAGNDLDLSTLKVRVEPDAGTSQTVTVTTTRKSDGSVDYTGTIPATTWDANATNFKATAEVLDEATNRGFASTLPFTIDLNRPALHTPGEVLNSKLIAVKFGEIIGQGPTALQRDETSKVRGGCDPEAWLIDGVPGRVKNVTDASGQVLTDGNCDPSRQTDGVRFLVLADNYSIDAVSTPPVRYDVLERALGFRPAKDGTGTDALSALITTVNNIVPLAPSLVRVDRKNLNGSGTESAYFDADEKVYYTNATGTGDNTVTVGGIRDGYVLQVRDANNRVLAASSPYRVAANQLGQPQSTQGTINVPVGDLQANGSYVITDKTYERRLHLVSSRGFVSEALTIQVALDRVVPALGATTWDAATTTATQKFNEKVVAGSNGSDNWHAAYTVAGDGGPKTAYTAANTVTTVDVFTRALKFTLDDPTSFVDAEYLSTTGDRYEDRAGNLLLDTLAP